MRNGCIRSDSNSYNTIHDAVAAPIQLLRDIGEPEEIYWTWYRPFALILVVAVAFLYVLPIILFLPCFCILSLVRTFRIRYRSRYHTNPEDVRIAVIGSGWSGLQIIDRLTELGVTQIQGYERWEEIGGCWNPKIGYFNQAVHAPMYMTSFANYPYLEPNCKLRCDEMQNYNLDFCETRGLRKFYKFNSNVKGVHYDSISNTATLEILQKNDTKEFRTEPFDLVIYTSMASDPYIPVWEGQSDFKGEIVHSHFFKYENFHEIIRKKKKVVVIGGGKTAIDMLLPFQKIRYDSISWVCRNPYIFNKMELVFGPASIQKIFLGMCFGVAAFASLFSNRLSRWIMWCTGSLWAYDNHPNNKNGYKYKGGQLDNDQRRIMNTFDRQKMFQSGIRRLEPNGIRLENDKFIEADVLLLGTSCTTGLEKIQLTKDGLPYVLASNGNKLLNHFTFEDFPVFGLSSSVLSFGPQRARVHGDLAVYHLCVQEQPLTAEKARRLGRFQFGPNAYPKNIYNIYDGYSDTGVLYPMSSCILSFVFSGLVDVFNISIFFGKFICFAKQEPLDLNILPPQETKVHTYTQVDGIQIT